MARKKVAVKKSATANKSRARGKGAAGGVAAKPSRVSEASDAAAPTSSSSCGVKRPAPTMSLCPLAPASPQDAAASASDAAAAKAPAPVSGRPWKKSKGSSGAANPAETAAAAAAATASSAAAAAAEPTVSRPERTVEIGHSYSNSNHNLSDIPISRVERLVGSRYKVMHELGRGAFGTVLCAVDNHETDMKKRLVAVKLLNAAAELELKPSTLELDAKEHPRVTQDDDGSSGDEASACLVTCYEVMIEKKKCDGVSRHCRLAAAVLEKMDTDLRTWLRGRRDSCPTLPTAIRLSRQLFQAVEHLHSHGWVHTDIKPDNIFVLSGDTDVDVRFKLGDLGECRTTAALADENEPYRTTRWYRAPEVILQLGLGPPMDTWSAACVVGEYLASDALFAGANNIDMVDLMVQTVGMPDQALIVSSPKRETHFNYKEKLGNWVHQPLPDGWHINRSRSNTHNVYYANPFIHEDESQPNKAKTQWERPELKAGDGLPRGAVPEGWQLKTSRNSDAGSVYFTEVTGTGATQWDMPMSKSLSNQVLRQWPRFLTIAKCRRLVETVDQVLVWDQSCRPDATAVLASLPTWP